MKLKFISTLMILFGFGVGYSQQNPNESALRNQIENLQKNINQIQNTLDKTDGKAKFSASLSDSLYKVQDILMEMNDRLYWLTNKDSLLHIKENDELIKEGQTKMNGEIEGEEHAQVDVDSIPTMPDWSNMLKPKVKKRAYFFQWQNGVSLLLDNSTTNSALQFPSWKMKAISNPGATFLYAIRLGKPDESKLKMEFNIKKKLTSSNFTKASPWQLRFGLGLQRYEVNQSSDLEISRNTTTNEVVFTKSTQGFKQNTIGIYYIHIPITVWRKLGGDFYVEGGGFVDFLRKSKQTLTYKDAESYNIVREKTGNFGVNKFAYGATLAVGWKAFALFANYHINPLFEVKQNYNYNLMSVGVKFGY